VTAEHIAGVLGGAGRTGQWWRARCPVHLGNSSSLALRDGQRGLIVKCHAGCSKAAVRAALHRLDLDTRTAAPEPRDPEKLRLRQEAETADRKRRIAIALDIWNSSYDPSASWQVPRYLRSRGITIAIPDTIRTAGMHWHPSGEKRPMMVGLVEHVDHGPVGVSCTYLAIDGSQKATLDPVRMFHGPIGGGAVQLAPGGPVLAVAEGIETALSYMQVTQTPTWAALSASGIKALILPSQVTEVVIAADPDIPGIRAAHNAARRWLADGRRVRIVRPPPGCDFNDLLMAS
jgi:putative DNA primase/helicase